MDKYRKYKKFEKCSKCELLRYCRGCPTVSYGTTHNMYSADPQCWKKVYIMKVIVLEKTCKSEELKISEIDIPMQTDNHVLVKVHAFEINRSEFILRKYEADEDYITLPIVPGIECVVTVIESSDNNLKKGNKIVSLMKVWEEVLMVAMKNMH